MNIDWKYLAVGVSEWSSSFQQVLQCGMRRIIPLDQMHLFFIHNSSNIAHHRRVRKDQMTIGEWEALIAVKASNEYHGNPSIDEFYDVIIPNQYNLHLVNTDDLAKKHVHWSWGIHGNLTFDWQKNVAEVARRKAVLKE
jgi:hypothetical protein